MLVKSYRISFGLPTIITRSNNVYGPRQFPEKVVPKFVHLLSRGKPWYVRSIHIPINCIHCQS